MSTPAAGAILRLSDSMLQTLMLSEAARAAVPGLREAFNQHMASRRVSKPGCRACSKAPLKIAAAVQARQAVLGADPAAAGVLKTALGVPSDTRIRVHFASPSGVSFRDI